MAKKYVLEVQTALKNAGLYHLKLDGDFGKGSRDAIMQLLSNNTAASDALSKTDVISPPAAVPVEQVVTPTSKGYRLSSASLSKLSGLHADLVKVVKRAIEITDMDFAVNEGLRTVERQRQLYNSGASQTMKSNHLTGNAVDLVPTPSGKMNWNDWDNYYIMATAMRLAAEQLNIKVKWGGCWEVINGKTGNPKDWVNAYGDRQRAKGKKPFTDGPHFELA